MIFFDFKIDFETLHGVKIKTKGIAQFVTDILMLKESRTDMNIIFIDYKSISRESKKYIMKFCGIGCPITVHGEVGQVLFQNGIIAEKIEW